MLWRIVSWNKGAEAGGGQELLPQLTVVIVFTLLIHVGTSG